MSHTKSKIISHFHKVQNWCSCLAGSPPERDSETNVPCIFSFATFNTGLPKCFWRTSPFHLAAGKEDGGHVWEAFTSQTQHSLTVTEAAAAYPVVCPERTGDRFADYRAFSPLRPKYRLEFNIASG